MLETAYSRIRSQPMIQATSLAQRRIRIGVGAAGDGDHGGQLRVAQRREAAGQRHQQERERDGRPGARPADRARGMPCRASNQVEDRRMQDAT